MEPEYKNNDVKDSGDPSCLEDRTSESFGQVEGELLVGETQSLGLYDLKDELLQEGEQVGSYEKVDERSDLDCVTVNEVIPSTERAVVIGHESALDSETLNGMSTLEKAEKGSTSDFTSQTNMTHISEKVFVDSLREDSNIMNQSNKNVVDSGSDFDNLTRDRIRSGEVLVGDGERNPVSEAANIMDCTTERILYECVSETSRVGSRSQTTNRTEENGSDSESQSEITLTIEEDLIVDNMCYANSDILNRRRYTSKRTEDGDSDFESPMTKEVIVEEIRFPSESSGTVSHPPEEIMEVKEVDPVFDGTEAPEMGIGQCSSSQILDLHSDTQMHTWPEKATALKNLVKMKGAVAVSNVLRRLSGGKDDSGHSECEVKNVDVERPVEAPAMKGRIILYTRLGCQESKEVRAFMYERKLKPIEINVDIFPCRKLELEKNTGTSAVPRVYLNDFLVGGLSELKDMAESGEFDEKIKDIINEEPPPEAPLPPQSAEDDVSSSGKLDELASIVKKMKDSIVLNDRFYKMRRFNNCFLGSEAVDFLSQDQDIEREEAVNLGRTLVSKLFFCHVMDENIFEDGNHLYRFLEHDPAISSNCYNMKKGLVEFEPKRITEIASRLRFLSFAIFEAYVSEDGRHIDYRSINDCEEFRRYLRIIEELRRVELENISREEKLAFFINLHNMMAIHAILMLGYPSRALDRKKFFGEFKYVVGGCPYSLSAIQNGVLRGNQRPPYNLTKPFAQRDKRYKVALLYAEPLIHFALVCGSRSGPPLRCYSPGNIDNEMVDAARDFLRTGGLILDAKAKTASVSSIIRWYSADFGKNETEVMRHLSNYLESSKSQELLDLLAENQLRVTYQPYNWDPNC